MLEILLLALPIACGWWTVAKEELLKEFRDWLARFRTPPCCLLVRKAAYMPSCYYCASHWLTAAVLLLHPVKLVSDGWPGYLFAGLAIVFVANVYLTLFNALRAWLRGIQKWADRQERELSAGKEAF